MGQCVVHVMTKAIIAGKLLSSHCWLPNSYGIKWWCSISTSGIYSGCCQVFMELPHNLAPSNAGTASDGCQEHRMVSGPRRQECSWLQKPKTAILLIPLQRTFNNPPGLKVLREKNHGQVHSLGLHWQRTWIWKHHTSQSDSINRWICCLIYIVTTNDNFTKACFIFVMTKWGPHSICLLVTMLNSQFQTYNSWFYDPRISEIDVLSQPDWNQHSNNINAPFCLIPQVLQLINH